MIPSPWKLTSDRKPLKQVCCIPFRRSFLDLFNTLEETFLEKAESIDMLRVIEHGYKVKMVFTDQNVYSVDTFEDARKVEMYLNNMD